VLSPLERRRFTGGSARNQAIDAFFELKRDERSEALEIESPIEMKRGDQRRISALMMKIRRHTGRHTLLALRRAPDPPARHDPARKEKDAPRGVDSHFSPASRRRHARRRMRPQPAAEIIP